MNYKEHCKECKEKLGNDWAVVHRWLDEFAPQYFPSMSHRAIRHHKEGIEIVRKMWGDRAAEAARLHIIADMDKVLSEDEVNLKYGFSPIDRSYRSYRAPHNMICAMCGKMYVDHPMV